MIINKTTSDALLVNSLVLLDGSGDYITGVTEFDTETRSATHTGGPTTAVQWWFAFPPSTLPDALAALIPDEDDQRALMPHIRSHAKFTGKRAMDDTDTTPSYYHKILGPATPHLVQCSSCSTYFIVFITGDDKVYTTERANASDNHLTATEIADPGNYACDNCSNTVALLRE